MILLYIIVLIITFEILLLNSLLNLLIFYFLLRRLILSNIFIVYLVFITITLYRFQKLEITSNQLSVQYLVQNVTHVLSVTLSLIKNIITSRILLEVLSYVFTPKLLKSIMNLEQASWGDFQSIKVFEYNASLSFFWFGLLKLITQ